MIQYVDQPDYGSQLGAAIGGSIGSGLELLARQKLEDIRENRDLQRKKDLISHQLSLKSLLEGEEARQNEMKAQQDFQELLRLGVDPEDAALYMKFTEGGKTHFAKNLIEQRERQQGLQKRGLEPEEETIDFKEKITPKETEISFQEDEGLTGKERITREEKRYDKNLPLFQKEEEKLRGIENEQVALNRLSELNESGNLPKGLARLNVDFKSGELRVPFLANADTQAFVKTVNDFTTKAKESFGARVTNFELNRFMKRLPTLLNTEEGRRVILRQMSILNEINALHAQSLIDVFENQGGVRKIDFDKAERLAKKKIKPQLETLKKEYSSLDSLSKDLPKKKEKTEEVIELTKVTPGTPLTKEVVEVLKEKYPDKEQARKVARQLGYGF